MDPDCVYCRLPNRTDSRFGSDGKEGQPRGIRVTFWDFLDIQLPCFSKCWSFFYGRWNHRVLIHGLCGLIQCVSQPFWSSQRCLRHKTFQGEMF